MGPTGPDQALPTLAAPPHVKAEPPRGNVALKTDDKGRLKLPPPFLKFMQALGDETVFITSVDRKSVRVYPMTKWREAEVWLQSPEREADSAERLWRMANHYGAESGVDDQNRVLIPALLRQELSLVKADVYLCPTRSGRFDVLPEAVYMAQLEESHAHNRNDVELAVKQRMP